MTKPHQNEREILKSFIDFASASWHQLLILTTYFRMGRQDYISEKQVLLVTKIPLMRY